MSGETFLEKYQNRNWVSLFENNEVKRFVLSYPNETSRISISSTIYAFIRKVRETEPDFDISNLLDMDSIDAREKIWSVCLSYIDENKYRIAGMVKVYLKSLFDEANERENKRIRYKRKQQVPQVKARETEVPNHEQIYRLVDSTTHLRIQSIFLLSYSSGTKGQAFINLKVKHLRKALLDREKLREEFKAEKDKVEDPKAQEDLKKLINNLPLIVKIDAKIYPKRFKGNNIRDWYPMIICKNAEELLMKYYNKERSNANDDEPLFVTRNNKKLTQVLLSKTLKYNIEKFSKSNNGELKHTSPSLLRRSFFNRLIAGGMKDIYREFVMGHSLEIKAHYFNWEQNKKSILLSYIRCNFNRLDNNVTREISTLKEDSVSKDDKIKKLEEELEYLKSTAFTKDLITKIEKHGFKSIEIPEPKKTITKIIEIGDKEAFVKLNKEGYNLVSSDDEHFVMEKEVEE